MLNAKRGGTDDEEIASAFSWPKVWLINNAYEALHFGPQRERPTLPAGHTNRANFPELAATSAGSLGDGL